ncbi:MAG: FAD binding domain-containing protein [Acetobacteraceae bacterium]
MKPAPFDYVRAETVEEALDILRRHGPDARVLAGGQSLMPMLSMRLARPRVLVDVMGVPAFRHVRAERGGLSIGAAVRQASLEHRPGLAATQPLLAHALPWVGHAQTRNRGTACGSVAHADPSAELPLVMIALGAEVQLRSARRRRRVPAAQFFIGMMATSRADDELIEAIVLPDRRPGTGHAFREVGRRHGDFAIVACAAVVDGAGARLAVGGVADRPMAFALPLPGPELDAALDDVAWGVDARDDLHATASYRRGLIRRMGRATIEDAARCRD